MVTAIGVLATLGCQDEEDPPDRGFLTVDFEVAAFDDCSCPSPAPWHDDPMSEAGLPESLTVPVAAEGSIRGRADRRACRRKCRTLRALESFSFRAGRVDAVIIDADGQEQLFEVGNFPVRVSEGDFGGKVPGFSGSWELPVGIVSELRFHVFNIRARIGDERRRVFVPGGIVRLVARGDSPIEIRPESTTFASSQIDPARQLLSLPGPPRLPGPVILRPRVGMRLDEIRDHRSQNFVEGQAIVMFAPEASDEDIRDLHLTFGATVIDPSLCEDVELVEIQGLPAVEVASLYNASPLVETALANRFELPEAPAFPDDLHARQYSLHNTGQNGGTNDVDIDAPEAWGECDACTGDHRVKVAVLDTGLEWDHPDLFMNVWVNPAELPIIFDADSDGDVDQEDIDMLDVDGDRLITFVDFNSPAFALNAPGMCNNGPPPLACDRPAPNNDGRVTASDLLNSDVFIDGFSGGPGNIADFNQFSDGNSIADDLIGLNVSDQAVQVPPPGDEILVLPSETSPKFHGTGVAGIIASHGDNGGSDDILIARNIVGVSWETSLIPIRHCEDTVGNPRCTFSSTLRAISFAAAYEVDVLNRSGGNLFAFDDDGDLIDPTGGGIPPGLQDCQGADDCLAQMRALMVACGAEDMLIVAAAGNDGVDLDDPDRIHLISDVELENIVSVAAIDRRGEMWKRSNRGSTVVDFAAPGVEVWATKEPGSNHPDASHLVDGTSFAAPHVAGIAALMFAVNPDLTPVQAANILRDSVDPMGGLAGSETIEGGRINAFTAVEFAASAP